MYVIVTPDHDVYEEQLSNANPDFVAYHYGSPGLRAVPPAGVNAGRVYGFRALSALQYQQLMHQARVYAAGLRMGLGLPAAGGAPAPGPAVPAVAAPAMVWVAMETRRTTQVGSVVFAEG